MKLNLTRREFIKKGSTSLLGTAVIPHLLRSETAHAMAMPKGEPKDLNGYYDHFGVNEKIIREVMSTALSRGGDYCDVYFQNTIYNQIGLEDNAVNRAYSEVDFGVGIRR